MKLYEKCIKIIWNYMEKQWNYMKLYEKSMKLYGNYMKKI